MGRLSQVDSASGYRGASGVRVLIREKMDRTEAQVRSTHYASRISPKLKRQLRLEHSHEGQKGM